MDKLNDFKKGDRLPHQWPNAVNRQLFSVGNIGFVGGDLMQGPAGTAFFSGGSPATVLFELTENPHMPDSSRTTGDPVEPDCPWATGIPVMRTPEDETGQENIYFMGTGDEKTIFFPRCSHGFSGPGGKLVCDTPSVYSGDRVWACKNPQTGRWEEVGSPGGGEPSVITWLQVVMGSIEVDTIYALANPLTLNTATFLREDPTVNPETGEPEIAPPNTVCIVDTTRQTPCWPGDFVQASTTGETILIDTLTGVPPEEGHEEDETVEEFDVWEMTNRQSSQLVYPAVMGDGDGEGDLEHESYQYAQVTINGVTYEKTVFAGDLLAEGDVVHGGESCWVAYKPDVRQWQIAATPCYGPA